MFGSIIAISLGAALGAILRWMLGEALNALFPAIPPGTLAANLIGGYFIGIAFMAFAGLPQINSYWRLFIITGFLGGLTTFSSFTLEVGRLLLADRYLAAVTACALHVVGSLIMFFLGTGTVALWRGLGR